MPSSIGLRFYKIIMYADGDKKPLLLKDGHFDLLDHIEYFVKNNSNMNDNKELQRSWYIDIVPTKNIRSIHGYVRYGAYEFESNIVDRRTKKSNYKRKSTDLEEIPLYFQIWIPAGCEFGIAAFQSFQGRSCVTMVSRSIREAFVKSCPSFRLSFNKMMPEDFKGTALGNAPIKQIKLIRNSSPGDRFDSYLNGLARDEVEYEVSIRAKRKRALGTYFDFRKKQFNPDKLQILMHDGVQFDEAKAEIIIGGRARTVGIFGIQSDVGVIEMSDSVKIDPDGHPVFASIALETELIMKEFYQTLVSKG